MDKSKLSSARHKKVKVKTAKGRRISSTRWLQRQLNDPYVIQAKSEGYRSRAAYKLIEIEEKFHIFNKARTVIDLGANPGGWSQVAALFLERTNTSSQIIAVDLNEMEDLPGVDFIQGDFLEEETQHKIISLLGTNKVDVVLSDMAAASTGHAPTDHLRIMGLCEEAFYFAKEFLKPGGNFAAKILQGGAEAELLQQLKSNFKKVKHFKPDSSRSDSSEMYLVATGFRDGN